MAFRLGLFSRSQLFIALLILLSLILTKEPPTKESSNEIVIEVEKIKEALWNSGYRIMSLMMENNIRILIPEGDFKINNESAITMFIPNDDRITLGSRGSFHCQVLRSKIDKKMFDSGILSQGSELDCFSQNTDFKSTVEVTNPGEIDGVRIDRWNIYNDGKVIVHGVDGFFTLKPKPKPEPVDINEDKVEIKVDKIKKALWDSGYKIMSLMMDNNLRLVIPEKNWKDNTAVVNNQSVISMFIPTDEAASFTKWRPFKYTNFGVQMVGFKIDEKGLNEIRESGEEEIFFHSVRGGRLILHMLFITGADEIECAKVIHWDIYKDEQVAVHGVDDFFGCNRHGLL